MKYDYLIVGQGLAGSLLAWHFMQEGRKVLVLDKYDAAASSQVAAGVYLPITGRRIVRTWMADELIPFAENFYSSLGIYFKKIFLHKKPVLEIPDSVKSYNEWQQRKSHPDTGKYISRFYPPDFFPQMACPHGAVELTSSGFVDLKNLLVTLRDHLISNNSLTDAVFDFNLLRVDAVVSYDGYEAEKIIFCEGVSAMTNPYFKHLPFQPSKGEVLTICSELLPESHIINKGVFLLPLGNHHFKAGSTYEWKELNSTPTPQAREKLVQQLKAVLQVPFEVTGQQASVRPSVKGRRPYIGMCTANSKIGIFNGLGTKGVMLSPYFSKHFTDHLIRGEALMPEVSISQYDYLL